MTCDEKMNGNVVECLVLKAEIKEKKTGSIKSFNFHLL